MKLKNHPERISANRYLFSCDYSKKAMINKKNVDDRCFEYSIVVALRHNKIKSHPEKYKAIISYFLVKIIGVL